MNGGTEPLGRFFVAVVGGLLRTRLHPVTFFIAWIVAASIAVYVVEVNTPRGPGVDRQIILELYNRIEPGDTISSVQRMLIERGICDCHKSDVKGTEVWAISSPLEFGANNWVLYICFDNTICIAIGMRTLDSPSIAPRNGPVDRILAGNEAQWRLSLNYLSR